MARIKVLGDSPMQTPESATVQVRASLGEEMTPVKVMQKELCDGFMHVFNPGEVREIKCACPDLRHVRQFMDNAFFEVTLSMPEKLKLNRLAKKAAE